jgi:ATP-dependent HslUV protease ATP-binding subunit HslU
MKKFTPVRIVEELDKYIIGQDKAKRAVAIALRNRWRRQQVEGDLQHEIMPNNIILIGPTGVGKTEIARRLSKLANAPFIKVEASKFTEVGYVGRDVESMIRELMNIALNDVRTEMTKRVQAQAKVNARKRIIDILYPKAPLNPQDTEEEIKKKEERHQRIRKKMELLFDTGELNNRDVEISSERRTPQIDLFSHTGNESFELPIGEIMAGIMPIKKSDKKKKVKVSEAYKMLIEEEAGKLVKPDLVKKEAKKRVEDNGIIFIDEIDKIAGNENRTGADVSRSGVQRDLLPIVEGSNVPTKHGLIDTSHILFIAAGAFSTSKPSDLIPELQGRFPIREELHSLSKDDLHKILLYPKNSLTKQYIALFKAENVKLKFNEDAVEEIATFAAKANVKMEDIGARRLHTIMNSLLDEHLFNMPDSNMKSVTITRSKVNNKLDKIIKNEDLSKYIL